jgi:hypothetical protein
MFDEEEEFEFPRKWLDKRQYARMDPTTGLPQLVRVEPHFVAGTQEFIPNVVDIFVDDGPIMTMERDAAEAYIEDTGCVPMGVFAKHKQGKIN